MLTVWPGDSIRRIAQEIDDSYSWIYDWIERLEDAGFIRQDDGVYIENYAVRGCYHDIVAAISRPIPPSIDDGYVISHFAGMPFAYRKIDSVYVWTHGGYQIARGHDDYPIFIQVDDQNVEQWTGFFDELGIGLKNGRIQPPVMRRSCTCCSRQLGTSLESGSMATGHPVG